MTPIADMVKMMLDRGIQQDVIIAAIKTIEMSRTNVPDIREYERTRKRAWRIKTKPEEGLPKANDVGSGEENVRDNVPDKRLFLSSSSFLTDSQRSKEEVVSGRKRNGTRLTTEWRPTPELEQFARDRGIDPQKFRDEFVDYWIAIPGQRGCKSDWSATWRNRVRAISGQTGAPNGKFHGRRVQTASERAYDLADELERRQTEFVRSTQSGRSG